MIAKDFASSLTKNQQTSMDRILKNPLVWAEVLFPPKIKRISYDEEVQTVVDGVLKKEIVKKYEDQVSEGWLTRPWQQEVVEHPSRKKVVRVSRRAGKMAPLDSIVYTPTGPKLMGEIKAGSIVCTPDGENAKVLEVFPHYQKPIYTITFNDGAKVEAGLEHLWEVTTSSWKYEGRNRRPAVKDTRVVDTAWIIENLPKFKTNGQSIAIYATKPVQFEKKNLPLDPYLLGTIIGDGYIFKSGSVQLALGDSQQVSIIKNILDDGHNLNYLSKVSYGISSRGNVCEKPIYQTMKELGLAGTVANTKHIPEEYLYSSAEQRLALLQGLMDTDGTIDKVGRITFTTVSSSLSEGMQKLVWSLGGTCSITTKTPSYSYLGEKRTGQLAYNLQIFFSDDIVPFRLERKIERLVKRNVRVKRHISSVELTSIKDAQCIMIDHPDHLYLMDGYIPTHNTQLAIVKTLHKSFVEGMGVLVVAPMERQVIEIYNTLHRQFIDTKPDVFIKGQSIVQDTKSPYVIRFANGGFINFITAGTKSGGKGEAVRGQGHGVGLIYIDEADYMTDDDLEAILAIQIQSVSMEVILTSTPTGKRNKFYELCTSPPKGWAAFHKTAWEAIPGFNEDRATEFRQQYGADGYDREFMANFGDEVTGVFDKQSIDDAMERGKDVFPFKDEYGRAESIKYPNFGYSQKATPNPDVYRIVGVDWDKYGAGTQILVVEANKGDYNKKNMYDRALNQPFEYITVIHRREIPKSKFTLSNAVNHLVQINQLFQPDFYYLDAGYGEHQIESLQLLGMNCTDPDDPAFGIHKKIRRVNFSEMAQVIDPVSKQPTKKPIKPEMVGRLVQKFESGEMILSPYDVDLQKQLENYIVEKITASGQPKYTSINEHQVDALMLANWGLFQQFAPKTLEGVTKAFIEKPIGERYLELQKQSQEAQKKLGTRPDYFRNDDVDMQNIQEDMTFAKNGMIRPENITTSHGVPEGGRSRLDQVSSFQRGGRGWSPRKGF